MNKRLRLAALLLTFFCLYRVTLAQQNCGNGLPCGAIPWTLPNFPVLNSPTPMPTVAITAISTAAPPPTSVPPSTPMPTGTIDADFSSLADQLGTLQAVVNATSPPVMVSGTPMDTTTQLTELGADAGTFFGYVRGLSQANLGNGITPFLTAIFAGLVLVIGIKSLGYILPIAAVLFRLILRIVEVVRKLIGL